MYNAENFIVDTLKSVVNQTYKNIEIILVDDGSKDKSYTIALDYLKNTKRIFQIIKQNNSGVSMARNNGINLASGKWIIALDSDDLLVNCAIESMVKYSNDSDVVFSNYKIIKSKKNCEFTEKMRYISISGEVAAMMYYNRKYNFIAPASLVKKTFILDNNICYDEDCKFAEDDLYVWKLVATASRVTYFFCSFYLYYVHENSTMTASKWDKILTTKEPAIRVDENYIRKNNNTRTLRSSFLLRHYIGCLHAASIICSKKDYKKLYNKFDFASIYEKRKKEKLHSKLIMIVMRYFPMMMYYFFRILSYKNK